MKKALFLSLVLGVLGINLSIITSCGQITTNPTILGSWEYFPHARGNIWNYKNTIVDISSTSEAQRSPKYVEVSFSGTKTLGSYETQVMIFSGRTEISEIGTFWPICFPSVQTSSSLEGYYYFTDSEVLQIKSTVSREIFGIVYALPKFPIVKGQWEPYGWTPEKPFDTLGTAEVLGKETIIVEAGTFNNCIKISYNNEFFVWLAPNVGLVKTTFTLPQSGYSTVSTTELVSKNF